jgi:hypothetical protein
VGCPHHTTPDLVLCRKIEREREEEEEEEG